MRARTKVLPTAIRPQTTVLSESLGNAFTYEISRCLKQVVSISLKGITRLERWERAQKHGLNPPDDVKDILLKNTDEDYQKW